MLTGNPDRLNPFGGQVDVAPFNFENPAELASDSAPAGRTRLSDWLEENRERVGTRYASELARHFR